MPQIPVAGFVLEAVGAVALALILARFQRARPRAGVRDWSLGLWFQAGGLLASLAVGAAERPWQRTVLLSSTMVLAYWAPALVLLGTWSRWNDREQPAWRRVLLVGLGVLGMATTLLAPVAGRWGTLVRVGTLTLLAAIAHLAAGALLLRARASQFGPRVLAASFLGLAAEEGLFFAIAASGGRVQARDFASELVEAELVLLMLAGVGMVAWLLEEERESAVRLREALHRREALSAMGALVGGVAHEVRNPLFAISATLDALTSRLAGDGRTQALGAAMREQVQRLSHLMSELLEYGRPIAGDLVSESVSAVVARSIASSASLAEGAGVRLELGSRPARDLVLADGPRLHQVFQNLVQNAVEHTPREGRVLMEIEPEWRRGQEGVRCAVHDSGPGFDPVQLPRVFEPFFSGRRGGTGLGLSIVQRIVDQHAGEVEAANHPAGGAVVTVWLPSAPPRR